MFTQVVRILLLAVLSASSALSFPTTLSNTTTTTTTSSDLTPRGASFPHCTKDQIYVLQKALPIAQGYASSASSYLSKTKSPNTPRIKTWFGALSAYELDFVKIHFQRIANVGLTGFVYDCACDPKQAIALVVTDEIGKVTLCSGFWPLRRSGADSKADHLINVVSRFVKVGDTKAYTDGQDGARKLAQSNTIEAVFSAANHQYFASSNLK